MLLCVGVGKYHFSNLRRTIRRQLHSAETAHYRTAPIMDKEWVRGIFQFKSCFQGTSTSSGARVVPKRHQSPRQCHSILSSYPALFLFSFRHNLFPLVLGCRVISVSCFWWWVPPGQVVWGGSQSLGPSGWTPIVPISAPALRHCGFLLGPKLPGPFMLWASSAFLRPKLR